MYHSLAESANFSGSSTMTGDLLQAMPDPAKCEKRGLG
jgi:hypothetical protein